MGLTLTKSGMKENQKKKFPKKNAMKSKSDASKKATAKISSNSQPQTATQRKKTTDEHVLTNSFTKEGSTSSVFKNRNVMSTSRLSIITCSTAPGWMAAT